MISSKLSILALSLTVFAAGACRSSPASQEEISPEASLEVDPWLVCGASVEGRPIEYAVFGTGEDTILLIAGIHGSEEAGTPLLDDLADEITTAAEEPAWLRGRRVVLLPRANPDGLEAGRRHNARGIDLNRNFPSRNFDSRGRGGSCPLSEPESRVLHHLILRYEPARVLSFHMPVNVLDYDGPAEGLARAMAAVSPLPVKRIGSRPGSLGSWVGLDLGLPIVTVELPTSARDLDRAEAWELYGPMIFAAIQYEAPAGID